MSLYIHVTVCAWHTEIKATWLNLTWSVHMTCLNLKKVAIAYHKAQYLDLFSWHSTLLLSVHSFPPCHPITTCMLMIPSCSFRSSLATSLKTSVAYKLLYSSRLHWCPDDCLSSAKTELLFLGRKPQLNKIDNHALVLSNGHSVTPTPSARNLGLLLILILPCMFLPHSWF